MVELILFVAAVYFLVALALGAWTADEINCASSAILDRHVDIGVFAGVVINIFANAFIFTFDIVVAILRAAGVL